MSAAKLTQWRELMETVEMTTILDRVGDILIKLDKQPNLIIKPSLSRPGVSMNFLLRDSSAGMYNLVVVFEKDTTTIEKSNENGSVYAAKLVNESDISTLINDIIASYEVVQVLDDYETGLADSIDLDL